MTKLEKSLWIALNYQLSLTDTDRPDESSYLYLKRVLHQNTELFRVGVKVPFDYFEEYPSHYPAVIFLLTTNLQKMGLKVKSVMSSARVAASMHSEFEMTERDLTITNYKTNENNNENGGSISQQQLFTKPLKIVFDSDIESSDFKTKGSVYLDGIVENYRVHQMDGLLSPQLLSSVLDQLNNGEDFKLIASDGNAFPVHKWMLIARSSVFATLFRNEENMESISLAVDCKVDEIKQFIKFIYTGELEGLVTKELMQLAVKYRIKTLEDLCRAALQDVFFSEERMALIAMHLKSGSYFCVTKEQPDSDFSDMKKHTNYSLYTCTWNVLNLTWTKEIEEQETVNMSVPFEHGGQNLFRAELEMRKNPELGYTLKFFSFAHGSISCTLDKVKCYIHQEDSSLNQRIEMKDEPAVDEKIFQVFTTQFADQGELELTTPLTCPFVITFKAVLRSTIPSFVNKIIDSTWNEDLWASAVNRKMTDVEFLVGEEAFGAHRSLLSARSPVFAAMFASGMKEAATGQVRIEDVDPTTFQHLLKFLYTGMFEPSSVDRELFTVADKYGVETLMELCRPATKVVDMDHIYKTFLS